MSNINGGLLDGVRRIPSKVRDLIIDGGLPGAPLGFRLRGATQYGPPQAGTWRTGDVIPDRYGNVLVCTSGGTPGSWAGPVAAVFPTGDTYGKKDPANVLSAIAANGFAALAPGIYYGASTVGYGVGQAVRAPGGKMVTTWRNVGSVPAFTISNPGTYADNTPAALTGLAIDGTGASAGAAGFQAGDIVKLEIDTWVSNFTGGNIGAHFLHANYWTEQAQARIYVQNCDTGVKLDPQGTGTNSYDRCYFDIEFNQGANQNGIVFGGTSAGAFLLEGGLKLHGNWTNGASTATGKLVSFTTPNAGIQSSRLEWGIETGGAGTHVAQTINFGAASNTIKNCHGNIEFFPGATPWTPSNNNGNFWFDGPVFGDTSLLSKVMVPPTNSFFTSGFPTGWGGDIKFQIPRGDGMVFVEFELSVASGTVITAGEIIATGLPSWAIPANNRLFTVDMSGAYGCIEIDTSGNVKFQGPAQTVGASTIFPYGQATYSNSL